MNELPATVKVELKGSIDRATSGLQKEPNFVINMKITDIISHNPRCLPDVLKILLDKLDHKQAGVQVNAIELLSTIVSNCSGSVKLVGNPEFLKALVKTLPKSIRAPLKKHIFGGGPVEDLEKLHYCDRVLVFLRRCAEAFRNNEDYPAFIETYRSLNLNGVKFPELKGSDLVPIVMAALPKQPKPSATATTSNSSSRSNTNNNVSETELVKTLLGPYDIKAINVTNPGTMQFPDSRKVAIDANKILENMNLAVLYDYSFLAHVDSDILPNRPSGSTYLSIKSIADLSRIMVEKPLHNTTMANEISALKTSLLHIRNTINSGANIPPEKLNELFLLNDTLNDVIVYVEDVQSGKLKRGSRVHADKYEEALDSVSISAAMLQEYLDTKRNQPIPATLPKSSTTEPHSFMQAPAQARGSSIIPAVIVAPPQSPQQDIPVSPKQKPVVGRRGRGASTSVSPQNANNSNNQEDGTKDVLNLFEMMNMQENNQRSPTTEQVAIDLDDPFAMIAMGHNNSNTNNSNNTTQPSEPVATHTHTSQAYTTTNVTNNNNNYAHDDPFAMIANYNNTPQYPTNNTTTYNPTYENQSKNVHDDPFAMITSRSPAQELPNDFDIPAVDSNPHPIQPTVYTQAPPKQSSANVELTPEEDPFNFL